MTAFDSTRDHISRSTRSQKSLRINIGCGQTPTLGWRNLDNSFSVRLASLGSVSRLLSAVGLLDKSQAEFVDFAERNAIEYADATKIPCEDGVCEVLYSSHMVEHLDPDEAKSFLREAMRILRPGGIMRIAVPDIQKHVSDYCETGDADKFLASTHMCINRPKGLRQKLRMLIVGTRHHQWMYDGKSLSKLFVEQGFANPIVQSPGETLILDPSALDLNERAEESVYVEAIKPE
jgi:predicted SAM-dependent methyltransferase